ncbi:MAG TPA: UDP-N-acetylglucosamine 2-epimerase (non-hydrolyzing) [Gemmatimonadaceae bacterium]|jgi:UDP-N-acetylglucosamine 2-epimerase|nr:UDP-N-acetylglucosamine 2-epimerase (non-hydrolyzing) [Gemmatimonadaceae bacterium]
MSGIKVVTVVGARPQFIKAWPVGRALQEAGIEECLVHTGQHYDERMSRVFFDEMGIRRPERNLEVGSASHGAQTGRMLEALEQVLLEERPQWVVVYGDTNSTLAGALAACKLQLPIAHVEAGLRSFNRGMPEEHNRVLTDHCSELLLCPTQTAVDNLAREGVTHGVQLVGDVMYDAVLHFGAMARAQSRILEACAIRDGAYYLATIHRASNTDDAEKLMALLGSLDALDAPVILPLHPRTRERLAQHAPPERHSRLRLIEPVGYLDMLRLEQGARAIITDSGGVQKEAYFFGIPCFTMRTETEWVETVQSGWNALVGDEGGGLASTVSAYRRPTVPQPRLFGSGDAARRIVSLLLESPHSMSR